MTNRRLLIALCASASFSGCAQKVNLGAARDACFGALKIATKDTVSMSAMQIRLESPEQFAKGSGITFTIKPSDDGGDFICAIDDHRISKLSRGRTDLLPLVPESLRAI